MHYQTVRVWMSLLLAITACTQTPPVVISCHETPNSVRIISGQSLVGKTDRDIFIYPTEHRLATEKSGPEKLLVFLARIPEPPPGSIIVEGENMSTGTRRSFKANRHTSEFGTEWGANFSFPDPGCWGLSVNESGNEGRVVVDVR